MTTEQPVEVKPGLLPGINADILEMARDNPDAYALTNAAVLDIVRVAVAAALATRSPDPAPGEQLETAARAICCPGGCRNPEGSKFPCGWEAWKRQAAAVLAGEQGLVDELERLAAKATVAPWSRREEPWELQIVSGEDPVLELDPLRHPWPESVTWQRREATAELILALRNNLPTILAALRSTAPQVPSEAVVEQVARAIYTSRANRWPNSATWEELFDRTRQQFRGDARAALASLPSLSEDTRSTAVGEELVICKSCCQTFPAFAKHDCPGLLPKPAPTQAAKLADALCDIAEDLDKEGTHWRANRVREAAVLVRQPPQAVDHAERIAARMGATFVPRVVDRDAGEALNIMHTAFAGYADTPAKREAVEIAAGVLKSLPDTSGLMDRG